MSVDTVEILKLANILHQNGDKVLNALSKLALNATLLQKINKEFQVLLENGNQNDTSSFQVLATSNSNSQLIQDLQFLHDFFQKTVGLKLTNNAHLSLLNNKVDISKFKNIKYLEIKKIPIKEVVGLKVIQSQLESIICIRCLSMLEELLAECGGDNTSGFVWSELKEAVLSYNNIKIVDTSVAFAPWLQVLDLSHNQITDVKAIECLPNLKYINLSFNCLDVIPTFSKSARKKMQVLVMKNNYIENLGGLSGLDHLTELDLSCNWISNHEVLHPLLTMSNLQWLSLEGNPISFHSNYRNSTVGYLHINASFGDFILDKIKLSKHEKTIVGIRLCSLNRSGSGSFNRSFSKEPSVIKTPEEEKTEEKVNVVKKSGKVRLAVIPNLDDGTYEELPPEISDVNLLGSSTEHLITKKQLEKTRSAFGSDNWLRCEAGSAVHDILGLPSFEVTSSTPYDDLYLVAAMDSVKNVVTTKAVIENHCEQKLDLAKSFLSSGCEGNNEKKLDLPTDKNNELLDSFNSCVEDNGSNYFSIENSTDRIEISDNNEETITSKETSPDIEPIQDSEEEPEEENEKLYLVTKEVKLLNNEIKQEEIFLSLTDTEMKEKEPNRGKTITKWSLSSLESCIKLSSTQLQIIFDTIRRDKRERVYSLEASEVQDLYKRFSAILEDRTLSDMNQVVLRCVNCNSQFSKELKSRKSSGKSYCPFCNSEFVFEVDEEALPSSVIGKQEKNKINETKKTEIKSSHNRSSSAGVIQGLSSNYDDKIVKCPSRSSIGAEFSTSHSAEIPKCSAASFDELNELPSIQNSNVKRSDSDIEILSNPSQSSIEVIDGPPRFYGGNTPRRKKSSEERQLITPAQLVVPENLSVVNNLTGLTESSSSGSITDSICTAYENSSMVTSGSKSDNVDVLKESEGTDDENLATKKNFQELLEEVIENVSAKIPKALPKTNEKSSDKVQYSYTNFSKIDHRIKLFLYSTAFEDNNEEFIFLLRATVLFATSDIPQPSCIVGSNKKLYVLKVIGDEEGYETSKFLQKVDSLSFNSNSVKSMYTLSWYQGFGMKIEDVNEKLTEFLILLRDRTRTKNFLTFLTSTDLNFSNDFKLIPECIERPYLTLQHVLLSGASEDSNISYFCLFSHCSVIDDPNSREISTGGILTNTTDLILFNDQLKWFFEKSDQTPTWQYSQKLSNLMQVDVDESKVILHFLNETEGKEELWSLVMETEESVKELLNALKAPWEEMFSVPLQISSV